MAIMLMDWDFRLLAELSGFTSMQLTRSHYGLGSFELRMHPTAPGADALEVGQVLFFSDATHKAMLIEKRVRKSGEISVSGKTLKGLAARRICVPPVVDGGFFGWDRFSGTAEAAYHHYAKAHLYAPEDTKRTIPRLVGAGSQDRGIVLPWQSRFGNLDALFLDIGETTEIGWDIIPDFADKQYVFKAVPGRNLTTGHEKVIISIYNYNATDVIHTLDETAFKSTAYVGGSGEDENRLIMSFGNEATGTDRREMWIDAGSIFETEMLEAAANQKLKVAAVKESLTAEVLQTGLCRYGLDYDIGDRVIVVGEGMQTETRLLEMRESHDGNGIKLQATFGSEPVVAAQALRAAMQPIVR